MTRTAIVGAGIVGSSLAKHLSLLGEQVVLIDRSLFPLPGSTGHAPGFVGQFNEIPALTELAKRSVADYKTVDGGFNQVGGIEVAFDDDGKRLLSSRMEQARALGLPSRTLSDEEIRVNPFVKGALAGILFESDGTADAQRIALEDRRVAVENGAEVIQGAVQSLIRNDKVVGVRTSTRDILADRVVLTTGIWAKQLAQLAVYPVGHPYVHSPKRSPRQEPGPFCRWPEKHVYARDHGDYDGIGSYDHSAVYVGPDALEAEAYGKWEPMFDQVMDKAYSLLPKELSSTFTSVPRTNHSTDSGRAFNGIFAMTPDNLPLVGQVEPGLWSAVAVWVTHAGGSAELLARAITGRPLSPIDQDLLAQLDPTRFQGQPEADLQSRSLRAYNDIYNTD